jgi:hypothetical protein
MTLTNLDRDNVGQKLVRVAHSLIEAVHQPYLSKQPRKQIVLDNRFLFPLCCLPCSRLCIRGRLHMGLSANTCSMP